MLTPHKNLRTGETIWSAYKVPRIPVQILTGNHEADVIVIGAGISGAMIAHELCEAGYSVIIVDRRKPMHGSTFASTALLQYEIDLPLTKLAEKIGMKDATRAWRRSKLGLESLATKIRLLKIDCDYERRDTLYLSGDLLNSEELKKEREMRNLIGMQTGYITQKILKEEYGLHRKAALISYDNVSVNPVQLTAGFLKIAIACGAQIFADTNITEVQSHKNYANAITSNGYLLKAKHVVFATGYEIPKQLKNKKHNIASTWAIATKPQPDKIEKHFPLIWEASDPYLYLKTSKDGRIICGGADEEFSDAAHRDSLIPKKTALLERKLKKLLPHIDSTAEFAWAGSFGGTTTGLPMIGRIPDLPHCYAIMGFGGNGITFSRIAAEIVISAINGKADPDADLFSF